MTECLCTHTNQHREIERRDERGCGEKRDGRNVKKEETHNKRQKGDGKVQDLKPPTKQRKRQHDHPGSTLHRPRHGPIKSITLHSNGHNLPYKAHADCAPCTMTVSRLHQHHAVEKG